MKINRFYARVTYTYFSINKRKYGRTLYKENIFDTKTKASKWVSNYKKSIVRELNRYGGVPRKVKVVIKKV